MRIAVIAVGLLALSACSPWARSETGRAVVAGDEYRVFYLPSGPNTYVMRVTKFKWVEGLASEEKAFAIEATGQVAQQLCGGTPDMLSVDYSAGAIPYDVSWKCRP